MRSPLCGQGRCQESLLQPPGLKMGENRLFENCWNSKNDFLPLWYVGGAHLSVECVCGRGHLGHTPEVARGVMRCAYTLNTV